MRVYQERMGTNHVSSTEKGSLLGCASRLDHRDVIQSQGNKWRTRGDSKSICLKKWLIGGFNTPETYIYIYYRYHWGSSSQMYFENKPTSKPPADPRSQPSFDDEAVGGATTVPRRYAEVVQVCLEGVQFRKDLRGPETLRGAAAM